MEDIVNERIRRLHSDFLDPDGEYDIVSSLLSHRPEKNIPNHVEEVLTIEQQSGSAVVGIGSSSEDSILDNGSVFFYVKVAWFFATLLVIAWLSLRWMHRPLPKFLSKLQNSANFWTTTASTPGSTTKMTTTTNAIGEKDPSNTVDSAEKCSFQTAEAFRKRGQNLSSQFEMVKDGHEIRGETINKMEVTATILTQQSVQHIETTIITRENGDQEVETRENTTSVASEKKVLSTCHQRHQELELQQQELSSRSRSLSPPALRDESELVFTPASDHTKCNKAISTSSMPCPPKFAFAHECSNENNPSDTPAESLCEKYPASSPSTPLKFDTSMANVIPCATVEDSILHHPTPQKLAQEFCQNVEIIEQIFLRSSVKVDASRAVELALMHQSSQLSLQQQEKSFALQARRESSMQLEKYDKYLKELSEARVQCMDSIGRSLNHSVLMCLVLEGSRHVGNLLEALNYFSWRQLGALILQMACCLEDEEPASTSNDVDADSWSAYSFVPSFSFVRQLVGPSLTRTTEYICCALTFGVGFLFWKMVHTILRELHCPSLLHQGVNGLVLAMYLAQNPGSWVVVVRNLETYKFWASIQCFLTVFFFLPWRLIGTLVQEVICWNKANDKCKRGYHYTTTKMNRWQSIMQSVEYCVTRI